jgi:hypothetical protein
MYKIICVLKVCHLHCCIILAMWFMFNFFLKWALVYAHARNLIRRWSSIVTITRQGHLILLAIVARNRFLSTYTFNISVYFFFKHGPYSLPYFVRREKNGLKKGVIFHLLCVWVPLIFYTYTYVYPKAMHKMSLKVSLLLFAFYSML